MWLAAFSAASIFVCCFPGIDRPFSVGGRSFKRNLLMSKVRIVLFVLGTAALTFSGSAKATAQNWAIEYVKERQAAQIGRVLGKAAADKYLDSATPEIVGGVIALTGAWPAQVGLRVKNAQSNYDALFCGGTLIHKRFVLTAAHCSDFFVSPTQVQVVTGTQNLNSGGVKRNVAKITIHRLWDPSTFAFDVAIWKLAEDVQDIIPAVMIKRDEELALAATNDPATMTGWGTTSEGGSLSARLRQVTVPIVSRAICNRPSSYGGEVTVQMICAGLLAGGKDTCQGDSGGPLWVKNEAEKFIVAGITSWGAGCAQPSFPGVYTRLAIFTDWITRVVAAAGP
jgi:secreted trypsin-like serine protease